MRLFIGRVKSKKMEKTAVVEVERLVIHPVYKKRLRRSKKYHVQDDIGVNEGDRVKFVGCKPVSKTKRWRILEVIGDSDKRRVNK